MNGAIPLLAVTGPTATGKTEMAVRVARAVAGEIISVDAFQVYRGMEIGTAQPTEQDRQGVRFHLVGDRDPLRAMTVADFREQAEAAIRQIAGRGRLPILCGGTGLYLRALLQHFTLPPGPGVEGREIRRRLREQAAAEGLEVLYRRLTEVDPAAARRLSPADERRLVRALEVWELTGRRASELSGVDPAPGIRYNDATYVLACPRQALRQRIEARVQRMLAAGWLEEARRLREEGLTPDLPALRALGYADLFRVLEGQATVEAAAERIVLQTRQFAKRQLTWFRRDWGVTWMTWETPAEFERFTDHLREVASELRERL